MTANASYDFDLGHFEGKLLGESDQACIALGAAELHTQLGRLFQRNLRGDQRELLASAGALGAFPTRIQLAHALGWIDDDVHDDLNSVLCIGDEMRGPSPFAESIIADRCGSLKLAEKLLGDGARDGLGLSDGISAAVPQVDEAAARAARHRFEVTVELLTRQIDAIGARA